MVCPVTSGPGGSPNCAFFSSPMEARTSANLRSRSQGVILDLVPGSPMVFFLKLCVCVCVCVCVCALFVFFGGGWGGVFLQGVGTDS